MDDDEHRRKVAIARGLIFEKDFAVDSTAVNNLLKEESLVPVAVWFYILSYPLISLLAAERLL